MDKKGISAVVATVLIILITVAAVTIIWAAVIPMIKNQIAGGTQCLDAVSQVSVKTEGYTCLHDNGKIQLQIARGAKDFDLADIQILISEGGDTQSILLSTGTSGGTTVLSGFGSNEEIVVNTTDSDYENATKVEIAPIVAVGNTQETCGISGSVSLSACA